MDALMQSLMAKIKTLNETIWERRVTVPAIDEWLQNFAATNGPSPGERAHALFLLSNFMYFGSRQIREVLKAQVLVSQTLTTRFSAKNEGCS